VTPQEAAPRPETPAAPGTGSTSFTNRGDASAGSVLSPIDRLTELLYGIILVLTFTGTLRVAVQGGTDVTTMLWATVGCSLAWGLVDAAMYVFGNLASRNRSYFLLRKLRSDPTSARIALVASMPSAVADAVPPSDWDEVVTVLSRVPLPSRARVGRDDLLGGLAVFCLANAPFLPLAAPFLIFEDLDLAQRFSNAIALILLFGAGHQLARYTGEKPVHVALRFVAFGLFLVAATIALGG